MKKFVLLLFILLLFTGCNKEEKQVNYSSNYYQVASPYKEGVNNYSINSYDKEEVESMLMYLSTDYFSPNNSLYQEGQYLDNDSLKKMLNDYNTTEDLLNDSVTKPTYISTIYEQDYVANNNNLKGISLAIVLNTNQTYTQNGKTYNQKLDEEKVLDFGKKQATKLLNYLRNINELKSIKIVIGLYVESSNYLKGSFKYLGSTVNNKINFEYVNYNYRLLDGSANMQNDINNYNNAVVLKNSIKNYNTHVNIRGLYKENNLMKIDITINSNYLKQSEILDMANTMANNLNNFSSVTVKIYFISNNSTKALLINENNEAKIYMMEE